MSDDTLDLGPVVVDEAALWWNSYPRHRDKSRALATFARARKIASFEQIMSATAALTESVRGKRAAEIPYAVSFLRAEPWRPASPPITLPAPARRRRASGPRRLRVTTRAQELTASEQRDRWCHQHGVTVVEYEQNKHDADWLDLIKRRGIIIR